MSDDKVDCKYWDKCYQKNEAHINKYNHPPKTSSTSETKGNNLEVVDKRSRSRSPRKGRSNSKSPLPKKVRDRSRSPHKKDTNETESTRRSRSRSPHKRRSNSKSPLSKRSPHKKDKNETESSKRSRSRSPQKRRSNSKSPLSKRSPHKNAKNETESPNKKNTEDENESPSKNNKAETSDNTKTSVEKTEEVPDKVDNIEEKHYVKIFHTSVHNSKKDEYIELLKTNEFIHHKFLVEMPDEFYTFWAFCSSLTKSDKKPEEIFQNIGIQLVGPFEYLAGLFNNADIKEPGDYLRHWRFYYDPPEFQTIFIKKRTGVHYGYWRDDPHDKTNLLIAKNDVNKGCVFEFVAANCFQALLHFVENDFVSTPFNAGEVKKIKESVKKFAAEHDINLENFEDMRKQRDKTVVTKTFHKAGLVVPYERKTQLGYRPLMETDSNLKKILNKFTDAQGNKEIIGAAMEHLQPLISAANIAVDECDFGTTLELGIDLFCSGHKELHELIVSLLVPGYSLLKRPQYIAIIKAHLEYRRKGNCLSIFEKDY